MANGNKPIARLNFDVSLDLRTKIWIKCAEQNITLKEYITNLIQKDLEKK